MENGPPGKSPPLFVPPRAVKRVFPCRYPSEEQERQYEPQHIGPPSAKTLLSATMLNDRNWMADEIRRLHSKSPHTHSPCHTPVRLNTHAPHAQPKSKSTHLLHRRGRSETITFPLPLPGLTLCAEVLTLESGSARHIAILWRVS